MHSNSETTDSFDKLRTPDVFQRLPKAIYRRLCFKGAVAITKVMDKSKAADQFEKGKNIPLTELNQLSEGFNEEYEINQKGEDRVYPKTKGRGGNFEYI